MASTRAHLAAHPSSARTARCGARRGVRRSVRGPGRATGIGEQPRPAVRPGRDHCVSAITFTSTRDDPTGVPMRAAEIYMWSSPLDPAASALRRLTTNTSGEAFAILSPDGKKVVTDSNHCVFDPQAARLLRRSTSRVSRSSNLSTRRTCSCSTVTAAD